MFFASRKNESQSWRAGKSLFASAARTDAYSVKPLSLTFRLSSFAMMFFSLFLSSSSASNFRNSTDDLATWSERVSGECDEIQLESKWSASTSSPWEDRKCLAQSFHATCPWHRSCWQLCWMRRHSMEDWWWSKDLRLAWDTFGRSESCYYSRESSWSHQQYSQAKRLIKLHQIIGILDCLHIHCDSNFQYYYFFQYVFQFTIRYFSRVFNIINPIPMKERSYVC